jgi:hypothetical protein
MTASNWMETIATNGRHFKMPSTVFELYTKNIHQPCLLLEAEFQIPAK